MNSNTVSRCQAMVLKCGNNIKTTKGLTVKVNIISANIFNTNVIMLVPSPAIVLFIKLETFVFVLMVPVRVFTLS